MVSIAFIVTGVVTALVVYALLATPREFKAKKTEKVETGEIIKQLLVLAEHENTFSANSSPPSRSLELEPTSDARNDTLENFKQSPVSSSCPIPLGPCVTNAEIQAQICQRAYELYQGRGGVDGSAADDWRQAREEVLRRKAKAATTSS
jgi:hypothetical protein